MPAENPAPVPPDRSKRGLIVILVAIVLVIAWLVSSPMRRSPTTPPPLAELPVIPPAAPPAKTDFSSTRSVAPTGPLSIPPIVVAPAALPSPSVVLKPIPTSTPVVIQEGKTIDFSSGKPVLKNSEDDKAVIADAVKEMEEATKNVKFGPQPTSPTPAPAKP